MTLALVLVVALLLLSSSAGVAAAVLLSPLRARRRVLVNLTDGTALNGVLWRRHGRWLVLREARLHQPGGEAPIDGEAVIERARVLFVQVLP